MTRPRWQRPPLGLKSTTADRERTLSHQAQTPNRGPYEPVGIVLHAGRALFGSVFAQLRAVSVDTSDTSFRVYFIHDGALTEDQEEECRCAGSELLADYPDSVEGFEEIFLRSDMPERIVVPGILAYLRHEDPTQSDAIVRGGMIQEVLHEVSETPAKAYLRFAANRALLGEVTPSLRRVIVDWSKSPTTLTFYYDGPITDLEKSTGSRVVAKINAWLPEAQVRSVVERLDYPERWPIFPHSGITRGAVYDRWEPIPE